ncbi:mechanosensitive ion channel domain-containing protein [Hydrogenimonas thermophila]|uniref:Small-conductance mechanosensitive channel n=1 Tax=Hydrogenimonas thermophila TaxID=223786 RepID=A0A1I5NB24_9BACT|nr:mechanosensitive ion channel domain-containing protein [Hydrogenimonas thermophila]SFP18556.1 Small-conductance mechanosensitive channel [Hydrogenimonas thermophila]
MRFKFFHLILLFYAFALTQNIEASRTINNISENNRSVEQIDEKLLQLSQDLNEINQQINDEGVWQKIYANHLAYIKLNSDIEELKKKIRYYKARGSRKYHTKIQELKLKKSQLEERLKLLEEYKQNPFKTVVKPQEIKDIPTVTNPIAIISAFSFIKQLNEHLLRFENELESLKEFTSLLEKKTAILKEYLELKPDNKDYKQELKQVERELNDALDALSLNETALVVYRKKVDEINLRLTEQIKEQAKKAGTIGFSIAILLLFVLLLKWLIKRTITDNERFYMANKIINFTFVFLVVMILLFAYIENVSYLVTVLGFASAGIAIAMKDWFMSMLGWMVIVVGGSIHVGDRIRVDKDGMKYVGDVLDISLFRITILEDITLTTYLHNRRAGRIIFIPNNYIFTNMIANYSHATLKTVWDGIDFTITFDSNHKKAQLIAKETAKRYAKGYTDITRKQLNKLRARYSLKNTNVEPRVYSFLEENGIRISVWYLTNAYATLTLRSTISSEILDQIKEQEDITITYPSQRIYLEDSGFRSEDLEVRI